MLTHPRVACDSLALIVCARTAQNGLTPLRRASHDGHLKTVKVLLAHKADVNAKDPVSAGEGCEGAPMGLGGYGLGVEVWTQGSFMA